MAELSANPRGIPQAPFVARVEDFVKSLEEVEPTLKKFSEMIAKYKFMEGQLQRKRGSLDDKVPELKKTLDMVDFLLSRRGADEAVELTYELNDTLWSHAKVKDTEKVYLWLGANIMVEYPVEEARTLLEEKLSTARNSLRITQEDLEFIKEQITTMEVNLARVYNWDVKQRRAMKDAPSSS